MHQTEQVEAALVDDTVLERELLFVDGGWREPAGDRRIEVTNPATEQSLGFAPLGTVADVDRAVAAAQTAFPEWAAAPPAVRAEALRALADALERRSDQLAHLLATEVGIPIVLARGHQTTFPIWSLRLYADMIESHPFEERIGNSLVVQEAAGVVAAISPWNFPMLLAMNKVAPALAAGCTVVLKPSEVAPLNAFLLADAVEEAGLPPGVFNLVSGDGPTVGARLAAHPDVDVVSLTGSTGAGRRVAELAAGTIKRVQLELGGKSANIVLDDADLEHAVERGLEQCYWNTGQNCMAWSRMLVPRRLEGEVLELAGARAAAYVVGDPLDEASQLGPLVSEAQRGRVTGAIAEGLSAGATLVTGGLEPPYEVGHYVAATVLGGVTPEMGVAQEEIFGPVLCVMTYDGDDEAVRIANGTPYGLHGAVFSGDPDRATAVARRLRTGMVDVNGGPLNPHAPFGGYKQSGVGRELGRYGLGEYLEHKAIQY